MHVVGDVSLITPLLALKENLELEDMTLEDMTLEKGNEKVQVFIPCGGLIRTSSLHGAENID